MALLERFRASKVRRFDGIEGWISALKRNLYRATPSYHWSVDGRMKLIRTEGVPGLGRWLTWRSQYECIAGIVTFDGGNPG
jgi:hypothetical protein